MAIVTSSPWAGQPWGALPAATRPVSLEPREPRLSRAVASCISSTSSSSGPWGAGSPGLGRDPAASGPCPWASAGAASPCGGGAAGTPCAAAQALRSAISGPVGQCEPLWQEAARQRSPRLEPPQAPHVQASPSTSMGPASMCAASPTLTTRGTGPAGSDATGTWSEATEPPAPLPVAAGGVIHGGRRPTWTSSPSASSEPSEMTTTEAAQDPQ